VQPATFDLKKGTDAEGTEYDARIYQGDTYDSLEVITLPDLSSRGRPDTLTGATVSAAITNESQEVLGEFDIDVVDADLRQVKPTMTAAATAELPITSLASKAYWDLQVTWGGYTDTFLRGRVDITRQETQ
jgi:hypothetical protein